MKSIHLSRKVDITKMPGKRNTLASSQAFLEDLDFMHICNICQGSLHRGQNISYFPAFLLYHPFFTQMDGLHLPRHQPTNLLGFWLNIIIFKCKNWYIWMNRNITMLLLVDLMVRNNSVNL